ncbi:MAG TPA: YbfB/YjiJ family MFS transporter [Candidatus Omnitrophota bacterium]|nr:YbfB/YjiJ family MFS transporter [Candidatus Omnitrophota bacterium]
MTTTTRTLLSGMLACAVALGLGRFAFTPILPLMQAEHGFGTAVAGWLAAANNLGYLVGALWAGMVTSDAARHRLLGWGLAILVVTLGLMAVTDSMLAWNLIRGIAGVASAWVFVLASALVVPRLAELGHAKLSGWHFGGVGLGIAVAGIFVGLTGSAIGSVGGWIGAALIALAFAAYAWPALRDAHAAQANAAAPPPPVAFPLSLLAAAYFFEGMGYIVTGTFLVAMIKASPELRPLADLAWVLVGLAALPSAAAWSWLAAHRGFLFALVAAHVVQTLGVALPALSSSAPAVLLGAVMYGGTFLGIVGMALAFGRAITPATPARTMGLLTAAFGIGQIIGPVVAGWLAEGGDWAPALWFAAASVAAGTPLLLAGRWVTSRGAGLRRYPAR